MRNIVQQFGMKYYMCPTPYYMCPTPYFMCPTPYYMCPTPYACCCPQKDERTKPGNIYKMHAPSEIGSLGGKVLSAFVLTALYCQGQQKTRRKGTGTNCVAMEMLQTWSVANLCSLPGEVMLICIFQFVDPARSPGCAKVNRFDH